MTRSTRATRPRALDGPRRRTPLRGLLLSRFVPAATRVVPPVGGRSGSARRPDAHTFSAAGRSRTVLRRPARRYRRLRAAGLSRPLAAVRVRPAGPPAPGTSQSKCSGSSRSLSALTASADGWPYHYGDRTRQLPRERGSAQHAADGELGCRNRDCDTDRRSAARRRDRSAYEDQRRAYRYPHMPPAPRAGHTHGSGSAPTSAHRPNTSSAVPSAGMPATPMRRSSRAIWPSWQAAPRHGEHHLAANSAPQYGDVMRPVQAREGFPGRPGPVRFVRTRGGSR